MWPKNYPFSVFDQVFSNLSEINLGRFRPIINNFQPVIFYRYPHLMSRAVCHQWPAMNRVKKSSGKENQKRPLSYESASTFTKTMGSKSEPTLPAGNYFKCIPPSSKIISIEPIVLAW